MLKKQARLLTEQAKVSTGIEIHPAAKIGGSFVIDHGYGVVIGETATIGNNCYILQGVTLGGTKITKKITGKRHPSIGNNVEIGGFSKVLGNITVEDNVFIGPNCTITENIACNSAVKNKTTNLIIKTVNKISVA